MCVFAGEIKTIDIHEHPDTIHFGVDPGDDPSILTKYTKALRILKGQNAGDLGPPVPLSWKSTDKRTLNILDLAVRGQHKTQRSLGSQ